MSDRLVEIATYPTEAEASMVRARLEDAGVDARLAGEATAGWLWHLGSAISGVRLMVHEDDLPVARKVLKDIEKDLRQAAVEWPEDLYEDEDEEFADQTDRSEVPEELKRAWRAAVIGIALLPPLLTVYSMWILVKNRFFAPAHHTNWRVVSAIAFNLLVFSVATALVVVAIAPRGGMEVRVGPPPSRVPDSELPERIPLKSEKRTTSYPLVPGP